MPKMRAVQVGRAGGELELVERDVPEPARGEVRVRIEACGVCHSDSFTVEGQMPGISFPRIPGHELGVEVVPCILGKQREAFTGNRMVNRVSPVQENRMIQKSLAELDEQTIAKVLGVSN